MKIYELKKYVYQGTETNSTKELKSKHPELVEGKDLRKKTSWLSIYNSLKAIEEFREELGEPKVLSAASKNLMIIDEDNV